MKNIVGVRKRPKFIIFILAIATIGSVIITGIIAIPKFFKKKIYACRTTTF